MLRKMETRGLVSHRTDGRSFVYRASIAEDKVSQGMTDHVLDRLFGGSVAALLNNLLTTREVSRDELVRLEKLIAQRKKQP
jgi:predicted transcriptional regulator